MGNYKHGFSSTPLYAIWTGIKQRCYNPKMTGYNRYGGRGIKMCAEWKNDAEKFIAWAQENGWRNNLQVDRIDNDGDYSPENCQLITCKENSRKRPTNNMFKWKGKMRCLAEIAEMENINRTTLSMRIHEYGMSFEQAVSYKGNKKPIRCIETGKEYESSHAAARDMKLHQGAISNVLLGKRKSLKGYTFEFI